MLQRNYLSNISFFGLSGIWKEKVHHFSLNNFPSSDCKSIWQELFEWCRYEDSEKSYKKFLELKPGNSVAEKELSQLYQAQSALESALSLFDSGDYTKALEYADKVVLVFSPACAKVRPNSIFLFPLLVLTFLIVKSVTNLCVLHYSPNKIFCILY